MAPSTLLRSTWFTFLTGSLFGFFIGSTVFSGLSVQLFSHDQTQSIEVTTHALRALASIRHFPENNGWGLVHVFYGNNSHLPLKNTIPTSKQFQSTWFGPFHQDYFVSRALNGKKGGFFVDLSAGNAVEGSQTYALETHFGWNGLCVEADSRYWEGLSFRRCDLVGAVVKESQTATAVPAVPSASVEPRLHHFVPLREILERFEAPRVIDYLSIGRLEEQHLIFIKFPFDRYRFLVITVQGPSTELQTMLKSHGYLLLLEIRDSETLWIHQSIQNTVDREGMVEEARTFAKDER